jgi:hypothetical protein
MALGNSRSSQSSLAVHNAIQLFSHQKVAGASTGSFEESPERIEQKLVFHFGLLDNNLKSARPIAPFSASLVLSKSSKRERGSFEDARSLNFRLMLNPSGPVNVTQQALTGTRIA